MHSEIDQRHQKSTIKGNQISFYDVGASWDSFTKALTYDKRSILQFKLRDALVVLNDSYDLRLQMRPYGLNNSLISWEGSYDTSKKILIEEIQEMNITWKKVILLLGAQVIAILLF